MTPRPPPTISRTQRWLDLVSFLVKRRYPVTVDQLRAEIPGYARALADGAQAESVRKMFERDKQELRALGLPIETVETRADGQLVEGYRLASPSLHLPYLRLLRDDDDSPRTPPPRGTAVMEVRAEEALEAVRGLETLAALTGFPHQAEARSALRKLTFDLSEVLDARVTKRVDTSDGPEAQQLLEPLTQAATERRTVTFRYHGITRDVVTERRVQPWGLVHRLGHWYLVGHDETRDARRTFRVSRMTAVELVPTPAGPHFEPPADLALEEWTRTRPWHLAEDFAGEPRDVVVRFSFPRCLHLERERVGEELSRDADGSMCRRFTVRDPDPFLRWLLTFEGEAAIESPADLADDLRALAASVAAIYHG